MSGINGEVIGYALIDENGHVVAKVGDMDLEGEEDWQELRDLVNNGGKYWTDGGEE